MQRTFISLALILGFYLSLTTGCQKTVSDVILDPDDSLAVFNIVILESGCPVITKNGIFLTEISLGANENIKAEVDVLKAGKWEYSTDTINGFSFSASGTFINTGRQEITLNGNGTPVSPGNYRFSIDTSGNNFLISVLKNNVQSETVGIVSYFKGTIDGVDYDFESLNGPDDVVYAAGGDNDKSFVSYHDAGRYASTPGPGTMAIQKDFIYNYSETTDADFLNFFSTGAYPYREVGDVCLPSNNSGVILAWSYTGGDAWVTIEGSHDQEGSSFVIVGAEDGHTSKGNYYVKVKSRFNCKLYKYDTGEMKLLTNGEMVSYFIKPL